MWSGSPNKAIKKELDNNKTLTGWTYTYVLSVKYNYWHQSLRWLVWLHLLECCVPVNSSKIWHLLLWKVCWCDSSVWRSRACNRYTQQQHNKSVSQLLTGCGHEWSTTFWKFQQCSTFFQVYRGFISQQSLKFAHIVFIECFWVRCGIFCLFAASVIIHIKFFYCTLTIKKPWNDSQPRVRLFPN